MNVTDQQEWDLCVSVAQTAPNSGITPVRSSTILAIQRERGELQREIDRLRAALSALDNAEPVAWKKADGAMTDGEYEASCWRSKGYAVRPLYDHPPRDEWRPASEPPEDARQVLGWQKRGHCESVHFLNGSWFVEATGRHTLTITHWRDIEPPTEGER